MAIAPSSSAQPSRREPSWASFSTHPDTSSDTDVSHFHLSTPLAGSSFTSTGGPATGITTPPESPIVKHTQYRLASPTRNHHTNTHEKNDMSHSSRKPQWRTVLTVLLPLIALILATASYRHLTRYPPLPNLDVIAQLMTTHAEIALDVTKDVKMLSQRATRKDFYEGDMRSLGDLVRPFSDDIAGSLDAAFDAILELNHGLLMPTVKIASKVNNLASQIDVMIPLLRKAHRAITLSSGTYRDIPSELELRKEYNLWITLHGHIRLTELLDALSSLTTSAEIILYQLRARVLPFLCEQRDSEGQNVVNTELRWELGLVRPWGGFLGWWRGKRWDGSAEVKARLELVDRVGKFADFVEGWSEEVGKVQGRVGKWLDAEGLWVYVEGMSPVGTPQPIYIEGYPHLSTISRRANPYADTDEEVNAPVTTQSTTSGPVDDVLAKLQPTLDELLDLTRRARKDMYEPNARLRRERTEQNQRERHARDRFEEEEGV